MITEDFIAKCQATHGTKKYDYSLSEYTGRHNKVNIKCNTCNKVFIQIAGDHYLDGKGCPSCQIVGFDPTEPAILYYLTVNNGAYYKIGITNRSVKERYTKSDLEEIRIVKEWSYPIGYDAREKESWIVREYADALYKGDAIILESAQGNAELFTYDVLGLDDAYKQLTLDFENSV